MTLRGILRSLPVVGPFVARASLASRRLRFKNSATYWEKRYRNGGNSGAGSYNRLAEFKANYLNNFVKRKSVKSVIEFGSGDGAQLELAEYPAYVGIDISKTAVDYIRRRYLAEEHYNFFYTSEYDSLQSFELSLSLDVVYHLVEDATFHQYMERLFDASSRFVIIYSSNHDAQTAGPHVKHREFTRWIEEHRPCFQLLEQVDNPYPFDATNEKNTSFANFYVFERSH